MFESLANLQGLRMYCTDCRREANPGREWLKLELISLYHFFKLIKNHIMILLTHIIKSLKLITTNTQDTG